MPYHKIKVSGGYKIENKETTKEKESRKYQQRNR